MILKKPWLLRILWVLFLLVLAGCFPFVWQAWINRQYTARIYDEATVRTERVAIVFGARVCSVICGEWLQRRGL